MKLGYVQGVGGGNYVLFGSKIAYLLAENALGNGGDILN
jgi:hypothetical protein